MIMMLNCLLDIYVYIRKHKLLGPMIGEVFCLVGFAFFQWLAVNADYITDQIAREKKEPESSTLNGTLVTFIFLHLAKAQKGNMSKRI